MLKIAIGTKSQYKINAINKAINELDIDCEIKAFDVNSEVSDQPKEKDETRTGSVNRAKNALKEWKDADFGIGVEFGYEPFDSSYRMLCWASIYTKEGEIFSEHSSSLELPSSWIEALNKNEQINDQLEEAFTKLDHGEVSRAFKHFVRKRRVIYECSENVLIRYMLNSKLY